MIQQRSLLSFVKLNTRNFLLSIHVRSLFFSRLMHSTWANTRVCETEFNTRGIYRSWFVDSRQTDPAPFWSALFREKMKRLPRRENQVSELLIASPLLRRSFNILDSSSFRIISFKGYFKLEQLLLTLSPYEDLGLFVYMIICFRFSSSPPREDDSRKDEQMT